MAYPNTYPLVTPQTFGAVGNGIILDDGTRSGVNFSSATAVFSINDVGKVIGIVGAGVSGATLITTIATFTNTNNITLTNPISGTISGAHFVYGTDDAAALTEFFTIQKGKGGTFLQGFVYISTTKQTCQLKNLNANNSPIVFLIPNNTDNCFTALPPQPGAASQINSKFFHTQLYLDAMATGFCLLSCPDGSPDFLGLTLDNSFNSAFLLNPQVSLAQFIENLTGYDWCFRNVGFHGMEVHLQGPNTATSAAFMNETNIWAWEIRGLGLRFGSGTGATAANAIRLTFDNISNIGQSKISHFFIYGCNWDCAVAGSLGGAAIGDVIYMNSINGTTARRVENFQLEPGGIESTNGIVAGTPMMINGNVFNTGDWIESIINEGQVFGWATGVNANFLASIEDANTYFLNSPAPTRGQFYLSALPRGTVGVSSPIGLPSGTQSPTKNYIDPNFTNSPTVFIANAAMVASTNLTFSIPIFPVNPAGGNFNNAPWPIKVVLYHAPFFNSFTQTTYAEYTVLTSFNNSDTSAHVEGILGLNQISSLPASSFIPLNVSFTLSGPNQSILNVIIPAGANVGTGGADVIVQLAASRWGMVMGQQQMSGDSDNPSLQINMTL